MDLREIVKRAPTLLHAIAALGGLAFGSLLLFTAYQTAIAVGNAPTSDAEHTAFIQTIAVGVFVFLFGVSQAAFAFKR